MEVPFFLSLQWWLTYFLEQYEQEPGHVLIEVTCILTIIYLIFSKSYDPQELKPLSKTEQDSLIDEWVPEPLCPPLPDKHGEIDDAIIVESAAGAHITVAGKSVLNMASFNFLGLADTEEVKQASRDCIEKYGVGSCGPRGFYGTIDVHVGFEKAIAKFCGFKESILYSDGLACVSSVIPAFAKRGDLIICDEGVSYGAQQGINLSRANVLHFKHNDMDDLELILKDVKERDFKNPKKKLNRRFIIVEGIYPNHGDIAPLDQIMKLKEQYKYRVLLDDSFAIGVLGKTGRGTPEHFGLPITDVDFYCVTADTTLATTGGFCMGSDVVVDHQRLSGSGYVYSASSPPFSAAAGMHNIGVMSQHPELGQQLRDKAATFRQMLQAIGGVVACGDVVSPVIHLRLQRSADNELDDIRVMRKVRKTAFQDGVVVEAPSYIPSEKRSPKPSIRVVVTVCHTESDLRQAATVLSKAFKSVLNA